MNEELSEADPRTSQGARLQVAKITDEWQRVGDVSEI